MNDNTQDQPKPQDYTLTAAERAVLSSINANAVGAKAKLHDLHEAIEEARRELAAAQQAFSGAVTLMANTHGMSQARITSDLTRIVVA